MSIGVIRGRLRRLGWEPHESTLLTLSGRKVCVVVCRRGQQSFSVQSPTGTVAWQGAYRLARQLDHGEKAPPAVLRIRRARRRTKATTPTGPSQ